MLTEIITNHDRTRFQGNGRTAHPEAMGTATHLVERPASHGLAAVAREIAAIILTTQERGTEEAAKREARAVIAELTPLFSLLPVDDIPSELLCTLKTLFDAQAQQASTTEEVILKRNDTFSVRQDSSELQFDPGFNTITARGERVTQHVLLTPTESMMFCCLFENIGLPVSKRQLIETIYAHEVFDASRKNSIEVCVSRMREKLELMVLQMTSPDPSLLIPVISTVRGKGYRLQIIKIADLVPPTATETAAALAAQQQQPVQQSQEPGTGTAVLYKSYKQFMQLAPHPNRAERLQKTGEGVQYSVR